MQKLYLTEMVEYRIYICALFRCISHCVRFIGDRRESNRQNRSRGVGRLWRFMSDGAQ